MITRTALGDCYCIGAEPKKYPCSSFSVLCTRYLNNKPIQTQRELHGKVQAFAIQMPRQYGCPCMEISKKSISRTWPKILGSLIQGPQNRSANLWKLPYRQGKEMSPSHVLESNVNPMVPWYGPLVLNPCKPVMTTLGTTFKIGAHSPEPFTEANQGPTRIPFHRRIRKLTHLGVSRPPGTQRFQKP